MARFSDVDRRRFLQGLSTLGVSALLAGCGSQSDLPLGASPSGPGGAPPQPAARGVSVSGRVDTTQVGGSNLNVLSIFQIEGPVSGGNFQTLVSDDTPQALLLLDGSRDLRALSLNLPGQSPTFDARSTALALAFLAPGISAMDVAVAQSRIAMILATPSFPALVQALTARLVTMNLKTILAVPEVQQRIVEVVLQADQQIQARQILARTLEESEQIRSDGYITMARDESNPTNITINLANEGWRFVQLVREEHFQGTQESTLPVLAGSPLTTNNRSNYMQGRNALSPISILLSVANNPGTAVDTIAQRADRPLDRIVYYVQGPGNPLALGHQSFPAHIKTLFDAYEYHTRPEYGMTAIYYFFFPIVEPLLAVAGISAKVAVKEVAELVDFLMKPVAQGGNGASVNMSIASGDEGNYRLALGETLFGFFSLAITGMAALLSGPIAVAAAIIEVALIAAGALLGTANIAIASNRFFYTPAESDVQLLIPRKFLNRLGPASEVEVQDLNDKGSMTVSRPGGLFLEPLGAAPVQLLATPGQALINDNNQCLFQSYDHLSHARLRFASGQITDLEPPEGALSTFAQGIVALSPQGIYVCKARRSDGKNDLYTLTAGGVLFLGSPEGLAPSTSVEILPSTLESGLLGNADPGSVEPGSPFEPLKNLGRLASYPFPSGPWQQTVFEPQVTGVLGSVKYVDVVKENALLVETRQSWGISPPSGVPWNTFLTFLAQTAAPFTSVRRTWIQGPRFRDVFQSTSFGPAGNAASVTHTAVALNDAGDVVGTITEGGSTRPVIWTEAGQFDLIPLFPIGAPPGSWRPLKMAGRFIVLEHTDGVGERSIYLFSRGL
jgi:hypothetical protein